MNFIKSIIIITLLTFLFSNQIVAQITAYHSIIFPYDNPAHVERPFINNSNTAAAIHNNPAILSYTEKMSIYIEYNRLISKYKLTADYDEKDYSKTQSYNFIPSLLSVKVPLKLYNKCFVITTNINNNYKPEFEYWDLPVDFHEDYEHEREKSVWSSTFSISSNLFKNFGLGISWRKWFGSWSWNDKIATYDLDTQGTFKYDGNIFTIAGLWKLKKVALGFAYHSPFTLMNTDNVKIPDIYLLPPYPSPSDKKFSIKQKFNGAFNSSIAFNYNDNLMFGVDYRYQHSSTIKRKNVVINDEADYSAAHKITASVEYNFKIKKVQLPIYFAYYLSTMPESIDDYIGYQILLNNDQKEYYNNFVLALKYIYKKVGFHVASEWKQNSIIIDNKNVYPPYR